MSSKRFLTVTEETVKELLPPSSTDNKAKSPAVLPYTGRLGTTG